MPQKTTCQEKEYLGKHIAWESANINEKAIIIIPLVRCFG